MENIRQLVFDFCIMHPDYKNDVNNVIAYFGESVFYGPFTIGGMTVEAIIKSLETLNKQGRITKKNTAWKYIYVVGMLFRYIIKNSSIENSDLLDKIESKYEESYCDICNKYINNCETLTGSKIYTSLDKDTAYDLVRWCDEKIEKMLHGEDESNYRIAYKHMTVAFCIKIMLLTGVTYRVARTLRFSDLDSKNNLLNINGFQFRLPLKLAKQLMEYEEFCRVKYEDHAYRFLFTNEKGEQWSEKTHSSGAPGFIKSITGQNDFTGIVKYGITQLLLVGVDSRLIMQITGAKQSIIDDCIMNFEQDEKYVYINSKICCTELYNKL